MTLTATDVETTTCNRTVILPCYVTDLKKKDVRVMFVIWFKEEKQIFSFDGATQEFSRDKTVPSANLVSQTALPNGDASLRLDSAEASDGNYTCQVTEENREGKVTLKLKNITGELPVVVLEPVVKENKQNLTGKRKIMNMTMYYLN